MNASKFVQFNAPAENANGEWYCKSVNQDHNGFYDFLAFGDVRRPYVTTVLTGHVLVCDSFRRAVGELKFYYEYHKASDLFNDIMNDYWDNIATGKLTAVLESQPMSFE